MSIDRCGGGFAWPVHGRALRATGKCSPASAASDSLCRSTQNSTAIQRPTQNTTTITMNKLSKRISALLRRKANVSTTDAPAPAETAAKVSYAHEILVDCDRDFCACGSSSANNSSHTPTTVATKTETIIPTSNMVSADASGFVERALESVRSVALLRDEPAATAVAGSSLPVHHLNPSQTHTLFAPSFPDPMMMMEWSVFGDETAVDSSVIVAATHVVKSDDGNNFDVFLSFVFKPTAVDAIIQYGDGESTHEVVLERFRLTGGKAIPLQSYVYAASATTETHTHCNGK